MAELPKAQDQTIFPIIRSASLDASNNKITFRPTPESRVRGLPIQSLSIAIDFLPSNLPIVSEENTSKEKQHITENTQLAVSTAKSSLLELVEENRKVSYPNMDFSEHGKQPRPIEDTSSFEVNSQIISVGDACEDLKDANSSRNVSALNNSINETILKSQHIEAFNFQEELGNRRKEEITFSFSDNMHDETENSELMSNDWLCEDKCHKQTDTSDLFEVYRELLSPKLPKWMNRITTFKNISGQGKIRKPPIPNISRHLMSLNEKDFKKCSCRSLENQVAFKKNEGKGNVHQTFDINTQEIDNSSNATQISLQNWLSSSEKEDRVLQKSSSDACSCNELEMSPISQNITKSSSSKLQTTENPFNLTKISLQDWPSNTDKAEEVLEKRASGICSCSDSETNPLSQNVAHFSNNMQTIDNPSNSSGMVSQNWLSKGENKNIELDKSTNDRHSCNDFEASSEESVGISLNKSHEIYPTKFSHVTPDNWPSIPDKEYQVMKKSARLTNSCNICEINMISKNFTEICLDKTQTIDPATSTKTISQTNLPHSDRVIAVQNSASTTRSEVGSIQQNTAASFVNKSQRNFNHVDETKKKKEAVVKPFTMTSANELEELNGTSQRLIKPSQMTELEDNSLILDDQVQSFASTSNSVGYLVTKPVMFYRSYQQASDKNSIMSVQLCNNCFDHLLNSDPDQNSDFQICNSNQNSTEVPSNITSSTMYATEHDTAISSSNIDSTLHTSDVNWTTSGSTNRCISTPRNCAKAEKPFSQHGLFQHPQKSAEQPTSEDKFLTPSKILNPHSPSQKFSEQDLNNEASSSHVSQEIHNGFKQRGEVETFERDIKKDLEQKLLIDNLITDSIDQISGDNLRRDDCIDSIKFKNACEMIKWHLNHPQSERDESLKTAVLLVQEKWFEISGSKRSKPEVVRNFINYFQRISPRLLTFVINSVCPDGNTVLHFAVVNSQFHVIKEVLRIRSCDVDKPNKAGNTPIIISATCRPESEEDKEIIRQLLIQGNINFQSLLRGQTTLMMAVNLNNMDMVCLLLETGANINIQDNDGSTALMYACYGGKIAIAMVLIKTHECDYFITDNDGFSAFDIAMQRNHIDIGFLIYVQMSEETSSWPLAKQGRTNTTARCKNKNSHCSQKSRYYYES